MPIKHVPTALSSHFLVKMYIEEAVSQGILKLNLAICVPLSSYCWYNENS